MYMNKITGMLWVNFSFFIIIISQKSVHKTKKNNTEKKKKKNKLEKLYFVLMGKVPKYGQNFKQYTIYTCNSLEEFSTLE